jgi:hypothetical protein
MKNIKTLLTASLIILAGFATEAHEGHDHDMPKGISAPKGGQIKAIDDNLIEVVSRGNELKIYFYDKELKPQDVAPFKVSAKVEKPRVKKQDDVSLNAAGNTFQAIYDATGLHRYTLILSVKSPKEDHADIVKFTIEPKK